ncbi:hypothetical protein LJ655_27305 [Paraburkholderia sp. MMS20-SJTN17]|uniref:Uncharacterized protein n=1 Tax=Paraburkholderia translucens TaxID=2886945 RepID=A0ABS8KL85_9BURK|nr:hypothetical protein [Paraburkholderia sp. MMS20-SJTN17]MCC8405521.1 hypothetical protein [Paraburkholderia sp. MMS20-SJTN17]
MTAFDSAPVLPGFERIGALIAKKAAETIKKVWTFLVFMCTPFLTVPAVPKPRRMRDVRHRPQVGIRQWFSLRFREFVGFTACYMRNRNTVNFNRNAEKLLATCTQDAANPLEVGPRAGDF